MSYVEKGKLGKLVAILLKLIGLAFGLGIAFLVLSDVLRNTFVNFMAIGLTLLGGVLAMVWFVLDDVMEVREALQNNDLRKLADMRNRAYNMLTLGSLMFLMAFVFVLAPLISIFGLASYVTAYIFLIMAIAVAVLLTDNIYIIKKASPGADKWWEETQKACELELLNKYTTKKDEDNRGGLMR